MRFWKYFEAIRAAPKQMSKDPPIRHFATRRNDNKVMLIEMYSDNGVLKVHAASPHFEATREAYGDRAKSRSIAKTRGDGSCPSGLQLRQSTIQLQRLRVSQCLLILNLTAMNNVAHR